MVKFNSHLEREFTPGLAALVQLSDLVFARCRRAEKMAKGETSGSKSPAIRALKVLLERGCAPSGRILIKILI
jgi:hypothetical protein